MQILALLSFNYEILFGGASTLSLCSLRNDLCVKVKHIYFKQERKVCQRKGTPPQKEKELQVMGLIHSSTIGPGCAKWNTLWPA